MERARTKTAQECERCHKLKIVTLDLLQDMWLCDDCFIKSYCEDCGDLLQGIEKSIGLCSICLANDHLADIDWGDHPEPLPDALCR